MNMLYRERAQRTLSLIDGYLRGSVLSKLEVVRELIYIATRDVVTVVYLDISQTDL